MTMPDSGDERQRNPLVTDDTVTVEQPEIGETAEAGDPAFGAPVADPEAELDLAEPGEPESAFPTAAEPITAGEVTAEPLAAIASEPVPPTDLPPLPTQAVSAPAAAAVSSTSDTVSTAAVMVRERGRTALAVLAEAARERPAAFLAGAAVGGFVTSRILRSPRSDS